jgi:hypothetical protein
MTLLGTKTYKNFIAGESVDAASGETFESTNPANGKTIGAFPKSGPEDVDRAVEAAKAAFETWRLVPAPRRGEIIFRFAQLLTEHKPELTDGPHHLLYIGRSIATPDLEHEFLPALSSAPTAQRLRISI